MPNPGLKRGTTILPDGRKVIYDGDLTVLDKDGELISWASSDLLEMLWGEDDEEEEHEPEGERRGEAHGKEGEEGDSKATQSCGERSSG